MRVIGTMVLMLIGYAAAIPQSATSSTRPIPKKILASRKEAIEIVHCLTARKLNWLGDQPPALERVRNFHVGIHHDRKTYPGEDVVFTVVFMTNREGDVFEITRKDHGNRRTYNLENNGSFRLGGKETEWPNEIFGGIWTHAYVEKNIRTLRRGLKTWVRLKVALKSGRQVGCSYYGSSENQ